MAEKRTQTYRNSDLNGYELAIPDNLPPAVRPRSASMDFRDIVFPEAFKNPLFKRAVLSTRNKDAVTDSKIGDKYVAAPIAFKIAEEKKLTSITSLGMKGFGRMVKYWLPEALKHHRLDRQSRIHQNVQERLMHQTQEAVEQPQEPEAQAPEAEA